VKILQSYLSSIITLGKGPKPLATQLSIIVQIRKLEQVIASVTARNLTLYRAVAKAVVTTTIRLRCD